MAETVPNGVRSDPRIKVNEDGVQAGMNSGENDGSPMQVKAMTLENGGNSGRTNATVTNDANAADKRRPTVPRQASSK
jgi:hypothetical protein